MTYRIKIAVFDGPFDLLLHLVKINEMDLDDIPVAQITNQYLEYIQMMKDLDLEVAGEFLVMAATLINIKARSLLPPRENDEDEDEIDEILSAKELMRRLLEYRKFKELADALRDREEHYSDVFFRTEVVPVPEAPQPQDDPMKEDLQNLFSAFSRILRFAEGRGFHSVSSDEYSVEDKIDHLKILLRKEKKVDILEVFKKCICRSEMIATFLATLEMGRMRLIVIEQSGPFNPILISFREDKIDYIT